MAQQYVYGALNRLEEAVNGAGKAAKYQYNGLGHRVGKAEGRLPADQTGKLDPQSRIDREIGNLTQIHYTIDLTREYHNLLEKTEGEKRQTYFWKAICQGCFLPKNTCETTKRVTRMFRL